MVSIWLSRLWEDGQDNRINIYLCSIYKETENMTKGFNELAEKLSLCFQISQGLPDPTILSIVGNSANAIAFLFFGPVPFIRMDTNVSTIQGGAALFGFGYALLLSSSFKRITNITSKLAYEDNANTNIAITS